MSPWRALLAALALAGCGRVFTPPPEAPPLVNAPPSKRLVLAEDGELRAEEDPFSRRSLRRVDHDLQATTLARGVSLVVAPAKGAPVYVSNQLAAALVRRFSGHTPLEAALAAPVVFLIRPVISEEALSQDGRIVVDWRLRTERGGDVGVVYAARRLSGVVSGPDLWTAFTAEDAEHLAFQTAANLLEEPAIRDGLARGAAEAEVARTPTPTPRPITVTAQGSQPAPRYAPRPRGRPKGLR